MAGCKAPGSAPHSGEFFGEIASTAAPLIRVIAVRLTEKEGDTVREMVFGHRTRSRARAKRADDLLRPPATPDCTLAPRRFLAPRSGHETNAAGAACYSATRTCNNFVSPDARSTTQLADLTTAN